MFEQTFKNIDDTLWKDAGCSSELDYVEQTSWVLFLKYLDDLEKDKQTSAELSGKTYTPIIDEKFKWDVWAAPKDANGELDHHKALSGDDLSEFVDGKLFPYLKKFKEHAESADTIEYKVGEIFSELKNKIQSGYNLREVINLVDELRFRTHKEKHEMSHLYESKIKNMGNAGRNGGEYYTPRPLIKTIVKVVAPEISDTIYDGAVGSAGFLCEAFEYLKTSKNLTTKQAETLQRKTFYGKEKKSLAYIIGIMNMILHGIEAPNIVHTNTWAESISDIQEKDRFNIILANPPFGGKERKEVQQNFPIKTGETAFLFLQHFIKKLNAGGRAGVVIKNNYWKAVICIRFWIYPAVHLPARALKLLCCFLKRVHLQKKYGFTSLTWIGIWARQILLTKMTWLNLWSYKRKRKILTIHGRWMLPRLIRRRLTFP